MDSVTVTATQAILAFRSPSDTACEVKVSEDATFASLVHDVDPVLFSGANMDNRPGAVVNGTARIFVAGKRLAARALDGNTYSRALQSFTTHYYQISCGAAQTSGTFKTSNIPMGMTYADALQPDPANPGQWVLPTQFQNRDQRIVDPQTGALLKRVSLDVEKDGADVGGVILSFGAFVRNCANKLQTAPDGTQGYLCTFFNNQAWGQLYYIIPATGEVRSLGTIQTAYPYVNEANNVYTNDDAGNTYRSTYSGDYKTAANTLSPANFSAPVLYNSVPMSQLMHRFDASFDPSLFYCSPTGADAGKYALVICNRHGQDSYGWVGIFYGGDGRTVDPACVGDSCPRIVAAMNVMAAPASKWCGLHNVQLVPGYPLVSINYSRLADFSGGMGTSAQVATLVSAISPTDTTLIVSGQPAPMNSDTYRQTLAAGDILALGQDQREVVKILGVTALANGQLSLQVSRDIWNNGAKAVAANTAVWPICSGWGSIGYWKFLNDTHGTDSAGVNVINDYYWGYGGHMDNGPLGRVEESGAGWQAVYGNIMDHLNQPVSLYLDDSPKFAGVHGLGYGNTTSKHPSYQQDATQASATDLQWFLDMTPFDGSDLLSDSSQIKLISGQLYQYFQAPGFGNALARKQLATSASTGGNSLIDVSGPGSQISDQPSDSYKYCVVDVTPGECRPGSQVGDIFINAPNVSYLRCTGGDGPNGNNKDLCLGNFDPYYQGMEQLYLSSVGTADATAHSRVITHGLTGLKGGTYFSLAKSLPDGSWALFTIADPLTGNTNVWMAKLPPFQPVDGVDRSTFVAAPLTLTPPSDSRIVSAVVDFGYAENGSPDQFRCTTRKDGCVATSGTVDASNPFQWASTSYTGAPCNAGCTISLPLLPMHAAYYRPRYLDASGLTVATGQIGVVADGLRQ